MFFLREQEFQRIMQKYGWQCSLKMKKRKRKGQAYGQKQLHLSSIQDLYNGEMIAYSIGDCQDTVCAAYVSPTQSFARRVYVAQ